MEMNSSRKRILHAVAALSLLAGGMAYGSCFIEAEQFADKGGWAVDSQFIDQMGSSFLLAHGMGKPVTDATTTFDCRAAGTYHVWARTRNWTAPWSEHAAGTFTIKVNGKELPNVLGRGTGDWQWQKAGEVRLEKGKATIALHDLTGFDGRCDVVYLSPVDGRPVMPAVRPLPPRHVKADLVVCGGGIAGTCAAIAAARLGLKVALVQDRPMLGGANSSEVRVHLGGYMNLGLYPRLGDVVAEIGPAKGGNAQPAARYEDSRKLDAVAAEKNIQLFLNTRVRWVSKRGDRIAYVTGQNVVTEERIDFEAPLFADCTGDACVGALAGADFRMGRESKAETGEDMAPDVADTMTMGASVQWYTKDTGRAVAFPAEPWMIAFNEQNCEHGLRGDWDWETGMMRDQISEFERIRDYGMLVVYSNWSYLKNKSAKREKYASREFEWVAYVAGKRESRRLMGDHILTQQDVFDFVPYPDGTCCTTWAFHLHAQQALRLPDPVPLPLLAERGESLHGGTQHLRDARRARDDARDAHDGHDGRSGGHGRARVQGPRLSAARRLRIPPRRPESVDGEGRGHGQDAAAAELQPRFAHPRHAAEEEKGLSQCGAAYGLSRRC